jgi:hypothetical protein
MFQVLFTDTIRKGVESECGGRIRYSCMQIETWDLLKLFQEWGESGIKENDGQGEFH